MARSPRGKEQTLLHPGVQAPDFSLPDQDGNTVTLASRLCESAGKGEIVISEETRSSLGEKIVAAARAPIRVKGIDRELQTYTVTGLGVT